MSAEHVQFTAGGTGNWARPVRTDPEGTAKAAFEAFLTHRLTFDDGRAFFLRARYMGVDVVAPDGSLAEEAGYGHVETRDVDGDWLFGHVLWEGREDPNESGGLYTFSGGTGKWEEATGTINATLWFVYEDVESSTTPALPPTTPVRVFGFLEGEGDLSAPNLNR